MAKVDVADLIRDLENSIQWLRESAVERLEAVEKQNPGLSEGELFQHYKNEVERGLDGLNAETVATVAHRSFLELRRKRGGFNPDHVTGA